MKPCLLMNSLEICGAIDIAQKRRVKYRSLIAVFLESARLVQRKRGVRKILLQRKTMSECDLVVVPVGMSSYITRLPARDASEFHSLQNLHYWDKNAAIALVTLMLPPPQTPSTDLFIQIYILKN